MRIFFSVGEPSGDLHGSNLIRHLAAADPTIEFVGFGGPKMKAAGCELLYDLTQMAVMFITQVVANLKFFFGLVDQADDYFAANEIDAVVLIDYPGFNWHIAKKAKARGIPVYYYGVPQMWAWAPWRIRKIRKYVDHVLCKLPFEKDWFESRNCKAIYVGHPFFDEMTQLNLDSEFIQQATDQLDLENKELVLLLPGSRNQEVERNLPTLIEAAEHIAADRPETAFAIGCFKESYAETANALLKNSSLSNVGVWTDRTQELMTSATCCMACSGSVSLELLYHRKPTVIVYRIKRTLQLVIPFLLKTQYITLPNLMAAKDIRKTTWRNSDPKRDPMVMPEYVSVNSPAEKMAGDVLQWLEDPAKLEASIATLDQMAKSYAKPGATKRAADYLLDTLGVQKSTANTRAA